ncbi:hypothetical protein [Massilia pseudoviolaceinigra]|uniref:hypothetical protein n=1 Tax=Massilia pseudoviolaceinigra TaxID=3057165 RepID=UPI0027964FB9|nr:hypothetical protein [Massilia sp. CCM 9206]MDQ1924449.1 hypothetical protein [Massilia sp. CCM 9206]
MSDEAGPPILEMHRIDGPDKWPMQMISADLLAHYRRCEAELAVLKAAARRAAEVGSNLAAALDVAQAGITRSM